MMMIRRLLLASWLALAFGSAWAGEAESSNTDGQALLANNDANAGGASGEANKSSHDEPVSAASVPSTADGDAHSGSAGSAEKHKSDLGWQSLLPGSIQ